MRKTILSIMTVTAMALALPAVAQYDNQSQGTQSDQQQMGTPQQGQGTQVFGTVVSFSDQNLVVRTDAGNTLTLSLNDQTNKPSQDLKPGDRIQVWYGSDRVATRITRAAQTEAGATTDTSSGFTGDRSQTDPTGAMGSDTTADTSGTAGTQDRTTTQTDRSFTSDRTTTTETERDTMAQSDQDRFSTDRGTYGDESGNLPQTGTSLPLIGLIGLVALAGAVAVRFFLRG